MKPVVTIFFFYTFLCNGFLHTCDQKKVEAAHLFAYQPKGRIDNLFYAGYNEHPNWYGTVKDCQSPEAEIRIDHVVIAVNYLDAAAQTYLKLGFTVKNGRLHANGLLNRHLKFKDKTQLELMTVIGSAGDEIARGYERFLMDGEGGAFLALTGLQNQVLQAAAAVQIEAESFNTSRLRYVIFSKRALGALFFMESDFQINDPEALLTHKNETTGIREVWVETSSDFGELLEILGAKKCGAVPLPDGRTGVVYGLSNGEVVLVPSLADRRRVIGAVLETAVHSELQFYTPDKTHGIWLGIPVPPHQNQ
jgi:hypothetical protein